MSCQLLRGRIQRLACNPITTMALLSLLAWDAMTLPISAVQGGVSYMGCLLHGGQYSQARTAANQWVHWLFRREDGGNLRPFDLDDPSSASVRIEAQSDAYTYFATSAFESRRTAGWWAITSRVMECDVVYVSIGGDPSKAERVQACATISDALTARGRAEWAASVRQGHYEMRTRVLWSGYIHNALALTAFAALLYSLQWIPKTPAWFRDRRRRRAASRGQCPACEYPIGASPVCSECGKPVPGRAKGVTA